MNIVYLNGQFIEEDKAYVPATDRGFLFGDGVFTTAFVNQGKIPFFEDHMLRIQKQCTTLGIEIPDISFKDISRLVLKNNGLRKKYRLRISITRGGPFSQTLKEKKVGQVLMQLLPFSDDEMKSLRLCVFPEPVVVPLANVKTMAYFLRFWIKDFAKKKGYDDCLVLGCQNEILEASFANIFWIKNTTLYYPDPSLPYLLGLSIQNILQAAKNIGLSIEKKRITVAELPSSASFFYSSCPVGFIPIVEIDGKEYPKNSEMEEKLLREYASISEEKSYTIDQSPEDL